MTAGPHTIFTYTNMATPSPHTSTPFAEPPAQDPVTAVFKAVADPTRLRLLNLLRIQGEVCVCDLTRVIDAPQATVSRHLACLRRTGLVQTRRESNWIHYRLSSAENDFHRKVLECLECCPDEVTQLRDDQAAVRGKPNYPCSPLT